MSTVRIKKINVLSMGKITGMCTGVLSFLYYTLFTLAIIPFLVENASSMGMLVGIARTEMIMAIAMFLLVPVLYGIFGFIAGMIIAIIFNIVSEQIGGLVMEIE